MNNLILLVVLPLITAFLLPVIDRFSTLAARWSGPLVLLITTFIGASAWLQLGTGAVSLELGGFRPPLGIVLYVDQLALLFAIAVSFGTLLLWPYGNRGGLRQQTLTLLLAGSGSGLALSGDLFNIYVFYELVAVVSYGLAVSLRTPAAFAAAIRYLIISGFGAALSLAGIALIYDATGTLNLAQLAQLAPEKLNDLQGLSAFVLLLIGIGVKAELFPVNTWVPEIYATAPKRVSALLAGLVSKLAVVVILRLLVLIFPQPEAHTLLLVLGILGVLTGELAAWRARDLPRVLAYSSIGQLGIVFIAFSVPGEAGVFAGLAMALHHLLIKPALFLLAERWDGSLAGLTGAAKASPLGAALFVLFSLSLLGIPPLPGFWAKLLVLTSLAQMGAALYYTGAVVIMLGMVLEANYLFRIIARMYQKAPSTGTPPGHGRLDLAISSMLGAGLIAAVFLLAPLADRLQGIAAQTVDVNQYIEAVNPVPTRNPI